MSVSLINGHIDDDSPECSNCSYYDIDNSDQPCCMCINFSNWESLNGNKNKGV